MYYLSLRTPGPVYLYLLLRPLRLALLVRDLSPSYKSSRTCRVSTGMRAMKVNEPGGVSVPGLLGVLGRKQRATVLMTGLTLLIAGAACAPSHGVPSAKPASVTEASTSPSASATRGNPRRPRRARLWRLLRPLQECCRRRQALLRRRRPSLPAAQHRCPTRLRGTEGPRRSP